MPILWTSILRQDPELLHSVADPHYFHVDPDPAWSFDADPDPDPTCHFDADPDPTFHFDADSEPTFLFDADPDPEPSFQINAQNLEKVLKQGHKPYILAWHLHLHSTYYVDADQNPGYHFDADPDSDPAYYFDADPDPTFQFDADPNSQHWLHRVHSETDSFLFLTGQG